MKNRIFNGVKKNKVEKTMKNVKNDLKQAHEKLNQMVDWAKGKYDHLDDNTKKKIVAGVLGTAALIAGAIGAKKIMKKKK